MDAGKLLDGFFLRPTFQLDDFRKSFADSLPYALMALVGSLSKSFLNAGSVHAFA